MRRVNSMRQHPSPSNSSSRCASANSSSTFCSNSEVAESEAPSIKTEEEQTHPGSCSRRARAALAEAFAKLVEARQGLAELGPILVDHFDSYKDIVSGHIISLTKGFFLAIGGIGR